MNNNWEKELREEYWIKELKLPDLIVNELTGFIRTQISEARKEIISEFIKGKRCFHCGKLKERGLSDWCGKCLEEA